MNPKTIRTIRQVVLEQSRTRRTIARLPKFLCGASLMLALLSLWQFTALGVSINLILGPGGAASLFNSSASSVILDSYSIDGSNLSPTGWDSLQSQGFSFAESSATSSQLSEATLAAGLLFGPGEYRLIGLPFVLVLQADATGDGTVDGDDYQIWQNNFGSTGAGGASIGDFNGNQSVDSVDYIIWRNSEGVTASYTFSATEHPPVTSVPDAGSTVILLGSALGLIGFLNRKRQTAEFPPR